MPCPSACQPRARQAVQLALPAAHMASGSINHTATICLFGLENRCSARWLDARAVAELVAALVLRHGAGGVRAVLEAPAPNALNGKFSWFGCGFAFGVWSGALRSHGVPARCPARAAADMRALMPGGPCCRAAGQRTWGRGGRDLSMRLL